jgi:predicted aminopeptidase
VTGCRRLLLLLAAVLLGGCETLAYYGQSVHGQLDLMRRARPIDELLADPDLDAGMAERLRLVKRLRRFASERLGLPENDSYRRYAALERRAVVWSVVATPPFDVNPKRWCYPLVGCLSYRGYFAQGDAWAEAGRLRAQHMDVAVLPVPAYSTLGWFDDPLPSTVIHWPEPELAGLIFHELAHQQVYVPGDTAFNEAYASAVAEIGVALWLKGTQAPQGQLAAWRTRSRRTAEVTRLLLAARRRLAKAFAEAPDDGQRARHKAAIYARLIRDYRDLSADWQPPRPYGHWFAKGAGTINNAHLAQVATYDLWVPAFKRLWQQSAGDPAAFHGRVEELGALPAAQRHQRLAALLPKPVGAASE